MSQHPPHFDPPIAQAIRTMLEEAAIASLATVDEYELPHAANVQVAVDAEWGFVWVSAESAAHSRHLQRTPRVALTIHGRDTSPERIHGLQIHGYAERLTDPHVREDALRTYAGRYPQIVANPRFAELIARQQLYRLTPTWMRWIDNRRGFGFKVEARFSLSPNEPRP